MYRNTVKWEAITPYMGGAKNPRLVLGWNTCSICGRMFFLFSMTIL
jgi:hypothetical protein